MSQLPVYTSIEEMIVHLQKMLSADDVPLSSLVLANIVLQFLLMEVDHGL